ncbi:hypothetical protein L195_g043726 [Trifolium pratense]|uniref:Uncharacterized protein n=1 Tax=Trifolium pratense TaxID=57577 RepID=A0A2K3MA40_TRIPR|nr:hypothetical protein L195_g043726 [Trifolium pratense]
MTESVTTTADVTGTSVSNDRSTAPIRSEQQPPALQRNGDSNQQQINDHRGGPAEVKRPLRVSDPKRG